MIRLSLPVAGSLVIAAMGLLIVTKHQEEGRLRTVIAAHESCFRDAGGTDPAATAVSCPAPIALQHRIARTSVRCDQALLGADLFAVDAACTTEVKTLLAQRDAEGRRADSLDEALKRARADQAAAVARAENRSRSQAERTARGQAAVSAAPRDDAGLVVCDAGCLRDRFTSPS